MSITQAMNLIQINDTDTWRLCHQTYNLCSLEQGQIYHREQRVMSSELVTARYEMGYLVAKKILKKKCKPKTPAIYQ